MFIGQAKDSDLLPIICNVLLFPPLKSCEMKAREGDIKKKMFVVFAVDGVGGRKGNMVKGNKRGIG